MSEGVDDGVVMMGRPAGMMPKRGEDMVVVGFGRDNGWWCWCWKVEGRAWSLGLSLRLEMVGVEGQMGELPLTAGSILQHHQRHK